MNFTPRQLADWRAFEKIRHGGAFNMFDRQAREAAGLRREECLFVMQHYAGLKEAAEASRKMAAAICGRPLQSLPKLFVKNYTTKHLLTTLATALAITASAWAEPANASAHDSEPVVSPDGKWHVFVRTFPGKEFASGTGGAPATELWQIGADGKNATVLVRPKDGLTGFEALQFSTDGRYVFFLSDDFATSRGLHVVDTTNGKERFICSAGGFEVIRSGEYRGCLLVGQHRYFISGGGSYYGLWVIRPDGQEVGPVAYFEVPELEATDFEGFEAGLADALKQFKGAK